MIDVKNKRCAAPKCYAHANRSYGDYCWWCYVHLFPDTPAGRNFETKEKAVTQFLTKAFPDKTLILGKRVAGGCSPYRPDILIDMGSHVVIIEIDEDQHASYICSCENKRVVQLWIAEGKRHVVFIRFNPDAYRDMEGRKVSSCWKRSARTIRVAHMADWEHRLNRRSARQRAAAFGRVSGKAFYEALLCWARCSSKECFVKRLTRNSFCRVKHFVNHATLGREIQV
jgi:hypothetical protein